MEPIFDDYYDSEGNLHIDARNYKDKSLGEVRNLVYHPSSSNFNDNFLARKLIIHHCNLIG